jgi:Rod binding domain-containing protein
LNVNQIATYRPMQTGQVSVTADGLEQVFLAEVMKCVGIREAAGSCFGEPMDSQSASMLNDCYAEILSKHVDLKLHSVLEEKNV